MTTSIGKCSALQGSRGLTLVEVLISMAISSMVLVAVFGSVLYIARSTLATADYSAMDREARTGLELFARDARMASNVSNFTANGVRLTLPSSGGPYIVDYRFVPVEGSFYKGFGTPQEEVLITGIQSFALKRYTILQSAATNDLETKQLQLELRAVRSGSAKAFASNNVISARYVLRNKTVSN